jgi:DNA replication and repair protein RecF
LRLKALRLEGYRNYGRLDLEIRRNINLFVGPNAQGKTNLLEAIYVLALTRSHRTHRDKELIGWNSESAKLYAEVERRYGTGKLEMLITPQGKKTRINGLEQRKLSQYVGSLNVVLFAPEDLELVKGSPAIRRRFLDMEIAQVHPSYLHHLGQYQRALAHRNRLLKEMSSSPTRAQAGMLDVWSEQLAAHGIKIMQKRQHFIQKLERWSRTIHEGITGGRERLDIAYAPSVSAADFDNESTVFEQFMVKLTEMKDQELRRGTTLVGPHRDDLVFFINGKEAQVFGSQGQQRTVALSLKLAEIECICQEVGEYPVLLLDDVLSELDRHRQTQLIRTFQDKVQTFVTATDIGTVDLNQLKDAQVYQVLDGAISGV